MVATPDEACRQKFDSLITLAHFPVLTNFRSTTGFPWRILLDYNGSSIENALSLDLYKNWIMNMIHIPAQVGVF